MNGAGLSTMALSDGILIDTTKPEPPYIDDHGDYTDSLSTLQGTFEGALDPESGIASFHYSLGTYDIPALLENDREVTTNVVGGNNYNLEINNVYFFNARAKNRAGLLSASTYSNGVMVIDPNQPQVTKIEDGGEFTSNNRSLTFNWELNDKSVYFKHFEYALLDSKEESIIMPPFINLIIWS